MKFVLAPAAIVLSLYLLDAHRSWWSTLAVIVAMALTSRLLIFFRRSKKNRKINSDYVGTR